MRTTSSVLSPAEKQICAAMGVSEKAYLVSSARQFIGRPMKYHSMQPDDVEHEAHVIQLTEGEDGKIRQRDARAGEGAPNDDDAGGDDESSPETHVQRAANHLAAYHDEENNTGRLTRLQGARAAIDRAMECQNSDGRDVMVRFGSPPDVPSASKRVGRYASLSSSELTAAMREIRRQMAGHHAQH
jgi:hypothetical protein